jgi:pimeloyl-ACP methyl ester carboxylesterase
MDRVEPRRVQSADGTGIAVHESGSVSGPTVVAVHGFPDNHHVWDGLAGLLGVDHRVVTYDVRGAGESDRPTACAAYAMPRLAEDLLAVLDAVALEAPVHLIGHDWGSVQVWGALTDSRVVERVRSFTSISGPSLVHAAVYLRAVHQHPAQSLRQALSSYYVGAFLLPGAPWLVERTGMARRLATSLDRAMRRPGDGSGWHDPADVLHGLNLYRANIGPRAPRRRRAPIAVPVQVIAPRYDRYITVALQTEAPRPFVPELRSRIVDGDHWVLACHPDRIVGHVVEFVGEHEPLR